jgi:hypothetical protein
MGNGMNKQQVKALCDQADQWEYDRPATMPTDPYIDLACITNVRPGWTLAGRDNILYTVTNINRLDYKKLVITFHDNEKQTIRDMRQVYLLVDNAVNHNLYDYLFKPELVIVARMMGCLYGNEPDHRLLYIVVPYRDNTACGIHFIEVRGGWYTPRYEMTAAMPIGEALDYLLHLKPTFVIRNDGTRLDTKVLDVHFLPKDVSDGLPIGAI